jgi:hypothetical protein
VRDSKREGKNETMEQSNNLSYTRILRRPKTRRRHQTQRDTRKKTRGKNQIETQIKRRDCAGLIRLDWTKRRDKDNERSHPEIQTEH